MVQDLARNASIYKQGGGGRYPSFSFNNYSINATHCGEATYDIAIALGFNTSSLFNGANRDSVNANTAGANLAKAAGNGLVSEVSGEQAQNLANNGYLVIASWINPKLNGMGHLATIRPDTAPYSADQGPRLSNIGLLDNSGIVSTQRAFGTLEGVKYYYDPNQEFKYDTTGIAKQQE
jgi:hypothetical protein